MLGAIRLTLFFVVPCIHESNDWSRFLGEMLSEVEEIDRTPSEVHPEIKIDTK
jgi:hypothetical protein